MDPSHTPVCKPLKPQLGLFSPWPGLFYPGQTCLVGQGQPLWAGTSPARGADFCPRKACLTFFHRNWPEGVGGAETTLQVKGTLWEKAWGWERVPRVPGAAQSSQRTGRRRWKGACQAGPQKPLAFQLILKTKGSPGSILNRSLMSGVFTLERLLCHQPA